MSSMARAIAWPIVTLLVIGATHLGLEAIRPGMHDVIGPPVVMPIYLVIGGWTAFGVARAGGGFVGGLIVAVALGLMPATLQVVGFGILLGRDADAVTTSALFGLAGMTWGGAIGSGIAAATLPVSVGVHRADRAATTNLAGEEARGT